MKILAIGDAHVADNQDLSRFNYVAKTIKKYRPDYIVIIGDFLSLNVLSEWDRNKKKKLENKRFKAEIEAGNEALNIIDDGIKEVQKTNKKYNPKKIYVEGNHEDRLKRFLDINPTFDGMVNIDIVLKLEERKWKFIKYRDEIKINGISFTHIPISGNNKPISGVNICKKALDLYSNSVVFGHTHKLEYTQNKRYNGDTNQALCIGSFFEHTEEYMDGGLDQKWAGLVILESIKENSFDYITLSMENLKNETR